MGYAICPIYKGKNGNEDFESCLHDLERVSYKEHRRLLDVDYFIRMQNKIK